MRGRWTLLFGPSTVAFAVVSLAFLLAVSLLDAIASLRIVQDFVGRTDWERGAWLWATYGTFTFAAFALADHALPRILRRAWGGGLCRRAAVARVRRRDPGRPGAHGRRHGGGILPGAGHPPDAAGAALLVYHAVAFAGIGMVALAGLALLMNLFLMYASGDRPSTACRAHQPPRRPGIEPPMTVHTPSIPARGPSAVGDRPHRLRLPGRRRVPALQSRRTESGVRHPRRQRRPPGPSGGPDPAVGQALITQGGCEGCHGGDLSPAPASSRAFTA